MEMGDLVSQEALVPDFPWAMSSKPEMMMMMMGCCSLQWGKTMQTNKHMQ